MNVRVAAIQCALGDSYETNVARVERLVRVAKERGAQIVLPPELFAGVYFCQREDPKYFAWAESFDDSPTVQSLAAQGDIDFETVLVTRGSYYDNHNRVFGEYVYHLDEGQMLRDPGLVQRIKCIVYNHGWPDVIRFAGGQVAIRREVWRRHSQNPGQVTARTVYECNTVVQ